ncbi:unnamed protein product [Moneuplotes crassus]|uniref:Uncharacterized protein n=1 Tax=Euplotes crassus TaxID=5936 RepID=A0AAD2D740_EUPCR|nr:unnamed protein product [Moneuplotes crassus]
MGCQGSTAKPKRGNKLNRPPNRRRAGGGKRSWVSKPKANENPGNHGGTGYAEDHYGGGNSGGGHSRGRHDGGDTNGKLVYNNGGGCGGVINHPLTSSLSYFESQMLISFFVIKDMYMIHLLLPHSPLKEHLYQFMAIL